MADDDEIILSELSDDELVLQMHDDLYDGLKEEIEEGVNILIARGWQLGPSRILPPTCRFMPSCSQYAIEALEKHGAIKGGWLAAKRLLRCHPWGGHGHDPVPDQIRRP